MKDLRDPLLLGEALLAQSDGTTSLSVVYDAHAAWFALTPSFDVTHQGPLEKYGRPQDRPEGV